MGFRYTFAHSRQSKTLSTMAFLRRSKHVHVSPFHKFNAKASSIRVLMLGPIATHHCGILLRQETHYPHGKQVAFRDSSYILHMHFEMGLKTVAIRMWIEYDACSWRSREIETNILFLWKNWSPNKLIFHIIGKFQVCIELHWMGRRTSAKNSIKSISRIGSYQNNYRIFQFTVLKIGEEISDHRSPFMCAC